MRATRTYLAYGFATTHEALEAESALKAAGVDAIPIPSPAALGELCGIAMRVPPDLAVRALEALASCGIEPQAVVEIQDV